MLKKSLAISILSLSLVSTIRTAEILSTYEEPVFFGTLIGGVIPLLNGITSPYVSGSSEPDSVKLRWIGNMVIRGAVLGASLAYLSTHTPYLYHNPLTTYVVMGAAGGICAALQGYYQIKDIPLHVRVTPLLHVVEKAQGA